MTRAVGDKVNSYLGEFIINNAKTIVTCVAFVAGLYVQHQANNIKIEQLQSQLVSVNTRLEQQYAKLDNVKLDKAVFEATMRQFSEMSTDIRSIREQLEAEMQNRSKN